MTINERGYEGFEGNEKTVGSVIDDPSKVRVTTPITAEKGGGGGVLSFNANQMGEAALGSRQKEMAMIRVEQAEDVRGQVGNLKAEFNFMLNDGSGEGDAAMVKPLAFTHDRITHISPGLAASFAALGSSGAVRSDTIWSPNGRSFTQQQDDGNFVTYTTKVPYSKAPDDCRAVWSAWTGAL